MVAHTTVRSLSWREWSAFAQDWERVHALCPNASFFLSREWVDCWLATFGEQLKPELLAFVSGGRVVGCCLLVWRTQLIKGIPLRRVYLNCAGENGADSTCIEFNSILSLPDFQRSVAGSLAKFLKARHWDELVLPGVVEGEAIRSLINGLGRSEAEQTPARYIDFSSIRNESRGFLGALSAKTRYHIRRTQRAYEEIGGPCAVQFAQNVEQALAMLRELAELHQVRWQARGKQGCFSSPKFVLFHERLIRRAFDQTMLFRLRAGDKVVGLLYCFVYRGWVFHYQSGFCYSLDARRSPGLLTLYHLISHCLERTDLKGFDFMAGDPEYKRSLAVEATPRQLSWLIVRRRTVPNLLFLSLRGVKRKYVQIIKKGLGPVQSPDWSEPVADVSVSNGEAEHAGTHQPLRGSEMRDAIG